MNSKLNCVFILSIITLQISLVSTGLTSLKVPVKVIVSPDSQNDTSDVKNEVENIRDAINGDDELPVATLQQLNDTFGVRLAINEAIKHHTYAKGKAVADNIDVQLKAKKDEDKFDTLNIAAVQQEEEAFAGKEPDTSTKKELPNQSLYEINPGLPPYRWMKHRWDEEKPLVWKIPKTDSVLKLPVFKLRNDFVRNLFARKNNN